MSNDDSKTEKPGLISRLLGWLFGHNTQGLKESSEPSLDRQIRQNDRNLTGVVVGIVGLFAYLGNADLSNFSLEFLINFNLCGSDFNSTIKSLSELIRTSWSSITALVALLFACGLFVVAVIILIRGACLNHQAKRVEASHDNAKTIKAHQEVEQAQQKVEQAQLEAAQYREIAETELDKLRERLALVEADIVQVRKELENVQSEASKASVERTKAETELVKVQACGVKLVYEALANTLNKKGN